MIAKLDKNNSQKIERMDRKVVENSISPIIINPLNAGNSIAGLGKTKKVKRSDSGNKIIL